MRDEIACEGEEVARLDREPFEAWVSSAPVGHVPSPEARMVLRLMHDKHRGKQPDEFYQLVANLYSHYGLANRNPGVILAEQNEVPLSTVHRWVKEARRRGFLAPGRRGPGVKDQSA